MKISVKARPNSSEQKIEKISDTEFNISIKEPPIQGKANRAIINALANYFGVSQAQVYIVSGFTSRQKTIEIRGL